MTNSLKLTQSSGVLITLCGYQVLIDAEDEARVQSRSWSVFERSSYIYLQTRIYVNGQKRSINLARFLTDAPKGKLALQKKDADPWDFRKRSIELVDMQTRQVKLGKRGSDSTSKYKGVHWDTKRGLWSAGIRPGGLSIFLGSFDSEEKAARAYDEAARLHFGSDAFQNFPDAEDGEKQDASA